MKIHENTFLPSIYIKFFCHILYLQHLLDYKVYRWIFSWRFSDLKVWTPVSHGFEEMNWAIATFSISLQPDSLNLYISNLDYIFLQNLIMKFGCKDIWNIKSEFVVRTLFFSRVNWSRFGKYLENNLEINTILVNTQIFLTSIFILNYFSHEQYPFW